MDSRKFSKALSLGLVSLLVLSGCESAAFSKMPWSKSASPKKSPCPQVGMMPDLGNVVKLRDDKVVTEMIIDRISPSCHVAEKEVVMRLDIGFKGRLGPEGMKDAIVEANYTIPYLIAVINPQGEIISKDVFAISPVYKERQAEVVISDLLEQTIPVESAKSAPDYKILVGFQLTPEELSYNRERATQKAAKQ